MRYKAVLFDLDNTLMKYDASENIAMKSAVEELGLTGHRGFSWAGYWEVFRRINTYYWENRADLHLDTGQMLRLSFGDTLSELGMDGSLAAPLADLYWRIFCRTCEFEVGAPELLAALHGKARLAIVSNGIGEAQRGRLAAGGVAHYFDAVVACDEVGCSKPDAAIFHLALERLGVDRKDALYVGDSLHFDFGGTRNAGIDFCYYCAGDEPVAGERKAGAAVGAGAAQRAAMAAGGGGSPAGTAVGGGAAQRVTEAAGGGGTSNDEDGAGGEMVGIQGDSASQPKFTVRHLCEIRDLLGV
ncbi:MAG: noncanonical pyrimidine nucleotidase, YjjG family protein [Paenibacillaceae bacterium]|jgi:FMN phosphatase YigB (HAD superfamily)|nr:noncanonical pyrimidine nucleotidase, YjjG family protein [Paenibacillaceae bacterium]